MRSYLRTILAILIFAGSAILSFAQKQTQYLQESDHYRVYSETSTAQAEDISRRMEAAFSLFNDIFDFDPALLRAKLNVRVFKNAGTFNIYVKKILSEQKMDFIFIIKSDPSKSELLCFPTDEKAFTASLVHAGAYQFINGFIDNPPIWIREGIAAYFDAAEFGPKSGIYNIKSDFAWLEILKYIIRGQGPTKLIPLRDLMNASSDMTITNRDVLFAESWGFTFFLLNSNDHAYSRVMQNAIKVLDSKASLEMNSKAASKSVFASISDQKLREDFEVYILSLKSGNELVREGIALYEKGDQLESEKTFEKAISVQPELDVAWYYLGLISYARKDYTKAAEMYGRASQQGRNVGLIKYALGVNAFAAAEYQDAVEFLQSAKDADPASYTEKVDALIKRIETEHNTSAYSKQQQDTTQSFSGTVKLVGFDFSPGGRDMHLNFALDEYRKRIFYVDVEKVGDSINLISDSAKIKLDCKYSSTSAYYGEVYQVLSFEILGMK